MDSHDVEAGKKTVEDWAKEKASADWLVAAARAAFGLPVGKELSERDFDAALEKVGRMEMRAGPSEPAKPVPQA